MRSVAWTSLSSARNCSRLPERWSAPRNRSATRFVTSSKRRSRPSHPGSFFSPADIELSDITKAIVAAVQRVNPMRVVFDPFSDVRLLARDPLRYRRHVLQLREFFVRRQCTVLLIQERTAAGTSDPAAEGIVQGIIALYQQAPEFGRQRRRLRVHKLRGVNFRDGFHDMAIETGGLQVYPRLIAVEHAQPAEQTEMTIRAGGVQIGDPLTEFRGILSGQLDYTGEGKELSKPSVQPPPQMA